MKTYELLFGAISIFSFILSFKLEDKVYKITSILAGFLILFVVYLSSNMSNIREIAESSSTEVKKLNEKINIYKKLTEHDIKIKNLERGIRNE